MAVTTEEILKAAGELGKLVAKHEAAGRFESVLKKLQDDIEAQRLLNDFNRQVMAVAEKQNAGKPIEVEDKHRLEKLQQDVTRHPLLRELQIAQMDYLDLMRRVDAAMTTAGPPEVSPEVSQQVSPQIFSEGT